MISIITKVAMAIEDTHMAVREARRRGQSVFGVTIDSKSQAAFGRIFGRGGFVVIPDPEKLTAALPQLYRHLVTWMSNALDRLPADKDDSDHHKAHTTQETGDDWGVLGELPGDLMMWVLIVSELLVFGAALIAFLAVRINRSGGVCCRSGVAQPH